MRVSSQILSLYSLSGDVAHSWYSVIGNIRREGGCVQMPGWNVCEQEGRVEQWTTLMGVCNQQLPEIGNDPARSAALMAPTLKRSDSRLVHHCCSMNRATALLSTF